MVIGMNNIYGSFCVSVISSYRCSLFFQDEHVDQSKETEKPGAVVSNHVSYVDILYHMSAFFPSFVAKVLQTFCDIVLAYVIFVIVIFSLSILILTCYFCISSLLEEISCQIAPSWSHKVAFFLSLESCFFLSFLPEIITRLVVDSLTG